NRASRCPSRRSASWHEPPAALASNRPAVEPKTTRPSSLHEKPRTPTDSAGAKLQNGSASPPFADARQIVAVAEPGFTPKATQAPSGEKTGENGFAGPLMVVVVASESRWIYS